MAVGVKSGRIGTIDMLRGEQDALAWLQQQGPAISVIAWIAVLVSCRGEENAAVDTWLACFPRFPLDDAIARESMRLCQTRGLKVPDAIILATAMCPGLTLTILSVRDLQLDLGGMLHPCRHGEP